MQPAPLPRYELPTRFYPTFHQLSLLLTIHLKAIMVRINTARPLYSFVFSRTSGLCLFSHVIIPAPFAPFPTRVLRGAKQEVGLR